MSLISALSARQKQLGIPSLLAMSKKIGVAYGSLYFLMNGKHQPNNRTVKKYAKFLDVAPEKVVSMVGKAKPRAVKRVVGKTKARASLRAKRRG
jgi:Helix-turn-helix